MGFADTYDSVKQESLHQSIARWSTCVHGLSSSSCLQTFGLIVLSVDSSIILDKSEISRQNSEALTVIWEGWLDLRFVLFFLLLLFGVNKHSHCHKSGTLAYKKTSTFYFFYLKDDFIGWDIEYILVGIQVQSICFLSVYTRITKLSIILRSTLVIQVIWYFFSLRWNARKH